MYKLNLLPKTEIKLLKYTVFLICVGIAYIAVKNLIWGGVDRYVFVLLFLIPSCIGLWLLKEPARLIINGIIIFFSILAPFGLINPFAAINDYGPNPPSVWELSISIFPLVLIGLVIAHILGKYKNEFTPIKHKKT